MKKLNETVLKFYQEGIMETDFQPAPDTTISEVESLLYQRGMDRLIVQLMHPLRKKIWEEYQVNLHPFSLQHSKEGLYLFGDINLMVYPFNEGHKVSEHIEALAADINLIREKLYEMTVAEVEPYAISRNVLQIALEKTVEQKYSESALEVEYDYFKHTNEVYIHSEYQPKGYFFSAHVHGIVMELKQEDSVLFKKGALSEEEAMEILSPVVDAIIQKTAHREDVKKIVEAKVKRDLIDNHGLTNAQIKRFIFSSHLNDSGKIRITKGSIFEPKVVIQYPFNVTKEEIAKGARFAKVLSVFIKEGGEIAKIAQYFRLGDEPSFDLSKGTLPIGYTVKAAELMVETIKTDLKKAKAFLLSGLYEYLPKTLPAYGKAFFIRKAHSFKVNDRTFELFVYRLPDSKKTKKLAFENGKEISLNRFYRLNRKLRQPA